MNKGELVDQLAQRTDLSKKEARAAVDALFDPKNGLIAQTLKRGERVTITGFGAFEVRERGERMARNPRTGKEMKLPASKAPAFRPGKALKEGVGRR